MSGIAALLIQDKFIVHRLALMLVLIFTAAMFISSARAVDSTTAASTLETIRSTGVLKCGVIREEEDYSKAETHGNRAAFDRDICRAIGAAVLGDAVRIVFVPYPDEPTAIKALSGAKVDVVATATPDFLNAIEFHIGFSPVVFFDGQGFLVKKSSGITNAKSLADKKVCFIDETTSAVNLALYGAREKINLLPFPFEEQGEMEAAMYTANCAAMTADVTQLANTRARFGTRAKEFEILPQLISKDPLAVAYRGGDATWSSVVDWTIAAILQAEESGVSASTVEQVRSNDVSKTSDPAVQLYFNGSSRMAGMLGLEPDWAVRSIKAAGNYGEMYERDLGKGSPLEIARGINALWRNGGLLYAPPIKK
jgi:general L-amino acid transport system substrate-binding protein